MFGSGIHLAAYVKGGVRIEGPDGGDPQPAIVVVPADAVTIDEGSWQVAGLAGTGSCNYSMDGVFVPDGWWFDFPVAAPRRGGDVHRLPIPAQVAVLHAGFPLGAARHALRIVTDDARTRIREWDNAPVSARGNFRFELTAHHLRLDAARLEVMAVAGRLEASAGTPDVIDRLFEMRAAAKFATDVALDIATWAYRNGGARALRLDHPLQRILRDLLGATQHVFVDDKVYAQYGAVLLGEELVW